MVVLWIGVSDVVTFIGLDVGLADAAHANLITITVARYTGVEFTWGRGCGLDRRFKARRIIIGIVDFTVIHSRADFRQWGDSSSVARITNGRLPVMDGELDHVNADVSALCHCRGSTYQCRRVTAV